MKNGLINDKIENKKQFQSLVYQAKLMLDKSLNLLQIKLKGFVILLLASSFINIQPVSQQLSNSYKLSSSQNQRPSKNIHDLLKSSLAKKVISNNQSVCFFSCRLLEYYVFILEKESMLQNKILYLTTMEKPNWHKIDKNTNKPCPRWGHTCTAIQDEVLFFGGYADSNYMNDLWTYHATERVWKEISTTGQKPTHRSNCTINYDPMTNQVVVFGGGGSNKQRFNSISVLDWNTKVWREIAPKQNEAAPWQRTYHVAQLLYPYLVVFGGQGLADMDDLWVFDFRSENWTEVKFDKDAVRPCARRFHSSCIIGNEFFVIAGCHSKYRCLSDVYSLDLTALITTGSTKQLQWVQRKLKGSSFLSRWGHSSAVYDGKIYVFAGRFSNDLNDLLVIDITNNSLKGIKIGSNSEPPKPRRRHSACFVGSCMIAFGGFNGEYFNDLHYINVFELNSKTQPYSDQHLSKIVGSMDFADAVIMASEEEAVPVHLGLIARYFKYEGDFSNYLSEINNHYSRKELLILLQSLYKGYGRLPDQILEKYGIEIPQSVNRRYLLNTLLEEEPNERNILSRVHQTMQKSTDWIVQLKREDFERVIQRRRQLWFTDGLIQIANTKIPVNKVIVSAHSSYFKAIFSGIYAQGSIARLVMDRTYSPIVFDILINFLSLGVLTVPQDYSTEGWTELAQIADYFCLSHLRSICESQLCVKVSQNNALSLQNFADKLSLNNLGMYCASYQLKQNRKDLNKSGWVQKLRSLMRLELSHGNWSQSTKSPILKKGESETLIQERENKQNNRECSNV